MNNLNRRSLSRPHFSAAPPAKVKPLRPAFDPYRFAHLRGVALPYEPVIEAPKAPRAMNSGESAAAIIAAGAKSRSATGNATKPTGLAGKILVAGQKRRGLEFA
jgi:hypothetical protein